MRSHEIAATNAWVLAHLPDLLVAVMVAIGTPLALTAARVQRWLRLAAWSAGAIAALGLLFVETTGTLAVITCVPVAIVAICAGVVGARRLLVRKFDPSRIAIGFGLVFLPAATTWLVSARAGYRLLDYDPFWVILTAAHFHVAGVYLMTIVGRVAEGRGRVAGAIAIACVVCVPLTAAGIYGPKWLEVGAAIAMASSGLATGVLLVTSRGIPLKIAGAILLVTMPLAGAFALRDHGTSVTLFGFEPLGSMMIAHGAPNALLFALIALAALGNWGRAPDSERTTS